MMPDGGQMTMTATADSRQALVEKLQGIVADVSTLYAICENYPVFCYLMFGISLVDPGRPVDPIPDSEQQEIEELILRGLSGQLTELAAVANRLLLGMDPRFGFIDRKHAEAYYAALLKRGFEEMLPIPQIQAAVNSQDRANAIANARAGQHA